MSEIFEEKIYELGIYIPENQLQNVYNVVREYCNGQYDLNASSGSSIIIVPKYKEGEEDRNMAIKVYLNLDLFNNVYRKYQDGMFDNSAFVNVLGASEEYKAIFMEKVIPVISSKCLDTISRTNSSGIRDDWTEEEIIKIKLDCKRNIITLMDEELVHNDFTLDNVGYSETRDVFVLFDIDSCRRMRENNESDRQTDSRSLEKSFNYHGI